MNANVNEDRIGQAARQLREAERSRTPCEPVRALFAAGDVASAYAVQNANTALAVAAGRRIVGRKIGLTSAAVQKQLGVDQPDYGALFADMCYGDGVEIPLERVLQPKAEAEITVLLGRDLAAADLTIVETMAAVEALLPSIEIVGSRIRNWDISIVDTIADNASSGVFALGWQSVAPAAVDLRLCGMVLEKNGEQGAVGVGAACLGHPLNALHWLARQMIAMGTPLRAGDLVMTGALGPTVPVAPGDWIEARIDGVGAVRTRFV